MMLHFLIGLAVCIWIAERVTHLSAPWRERRRQIHNYREGLPLARPWLSADEIERSVEDTFGVKPRRRQKSVRLGH
jgi:hypothetical protein